MYIPGGLAGKEVGLGNLNFQESIMMFKQKMKPSPKCTCIVHSNVHTFTYTRRYIYSVHFVAWCMLIRKLKKKQCAYWHIMQCW